jgi:ABC-type multidrug transport system ATPase subunit
VLKQKDDVRKTLGHMPQEFGVYPTMSAESLLDHFRCSKASPNNLVIDWRWTTISRG